MALVNVISYDGPSNVLIYRHPQRDFTTLSQLIVKESQKAILFKDGRMMDTFGPGKYTMHTGNIPLLNKVVNIPFGGESPFQCEVYFVNTAIALNRKWGTSSQARVMDRTYNLILHIGANGAMGLRVVDPRLAMMEIVGTQEQLTADECIQYFADNISMKVKEYIANVMKHPGMDFMQLDNNLTAFSQAVHELLKQDFSSVGVEIYNFAMSMLHVPDEEYAIVVQKLQITKQMEIEHIQKTMAARADAESMDIMGEAEARQKIRMGKASADARRIEGYNWADQQKAEIAKTYAASGVAQGNPANMIAQAPTAFAFGQMLRGTMDSVLNPNFSNDGINFSDKVLQSATPTFSSIPDDVEPMEDEIEVEEAPTPTTISPAKARLEKLKEFKEMLDLGLITQEDYDKHKERILSSI